MHNRINSNNPQDPLKFQVRRIQQQTDGRSLSIIIPSIFSKKLNLHRGDLLKASLESGSKLVFEKVNLLSGNQVSTPLSLGDVQ
ncbi:MAG TPA: hypothetical protein VKA95_06440 [Nitrososphaeraceae archaeon]|nr:hypothetical protein [Nitrososphaeraceae archaeon]